MTETEINEYEKDKRLIIETIKEQKPESLRQLLTFVKNKSNSSEEELFLIVQDLEDNEEIQFNEVVFHQSISSFAFSSQALWFWIVLFLAIFAFFSVFVIPADSGVLIYARNFFGLIFVWYLPGYSLFKIIFPIGVPVKTSSKALDIIERIVLSLSLSLAVTPMVGLVLYYTPWGLNLVVVTLSLFVVTVVFATSAVLREYRAKNMLSKKNSNIHLKNPAQTKKRNV